MDTIPRVATRTDFDDHVRRRQPVIYRPWPDVTALADDISRSTSGKRLPTQFPPPRPALPQPPFDAFLSYLTSYIGLTRRLLISEAKALSERWYISGIDLRCPAAAPAMDALDSIMPTDATTAATGCWISSAGCETGLHWDAFGPHNFHFLVSGEKEVFVAAPDQSEALYCGGGPRYLTRFVGVVDPMRPVDLERFPKYAECRGLRATLRAGDVLYLPAYWWHALVHTGAHNVSLTRWWVEPPSRHPPLPPLPARVHLNFLRYLIWEPCCAAAAAVARRLRGQPLPPAADAVADDGGGDRSARRRCTLRSDVLPNRRWTGPTGGLRGAGWLALAWIWAPFGFVLLLMRLQLLLLVIGATAAGVPPTIARVACRWIVAPLLGLRVAVDEPERLWSTASGGRGFRVVVANHVCFFDSAALCVAMPEACSMICGTLIGGQAQWEVLRRLGLVATAVFTAGSAATADDKRRTRAELDALKRQAAPLIAFPEGQAHGGGPLLRFERGVFALGVPVVPLALTVDLPLGAPLSLFTRTGSPLLSSLLPLWLPWVRWRIAVLPEAHPDDADADAPERFAARVQQQVAAALGMAATDYSMHEAATVIPAVAAALERAGMRDAIPSKHL